MAVIPLIQYTAAFIAARTREMFRVQRTSTHRKTNFSSSAAQNVSLLCSAPEHSSMLIQIGFFFYLKLGFHLHFLEDKTHLQTCTPKCEFLFFLRLVFFGGLIVIFE